MSENNDGFGMDILKGLKRVLFTSSAEEKKGGFAKCRNK